MRLGCALPLLMLSIGCGGEDELGGGQAEIEALPSACDHVDLVPLQGWRATASLTAINRSVLEGSLEMSGLDAGEIYTAHAIIFKNAAACSPPCDSDDVAPNSPALPSGPALLADGDARPDGTLEINFLLAGPWSNRDFIFMVADHGSPIDGQEAEQRTTYTVGEGCTLGPMGNWCPYSLFETLSCR